MNFVYSTLTNDVSYAIYAEDTQNIDKIDKLILIKGGANLANKELVTPKGFVTQVSDEDMELLANNYHFKEHVRNGFITYDKKEISIEKAIKDMQKRDESAPLTPDYYAGRNDIAKPEGMARDRR